MRKLRVLVSAVILACLSACGSSSSSSPSTTNQTPTLTTVTVSGTTPAVGATAQFTATASFSNGTSQSVTSQASWQSTNPAVAAVNASGIVTGVGAGPTDITASYQGVTGRMTITVIRSGFNVTGTVSDVGSGGTISGATIASSDGKSTTSATNGSYTLSGVSGAVTLTASAAGYSSSSKSVSVAADTRVDFALARTPLSGSVTVQGTPCVAPSSGPVSCTFVAAGFGGLAPYSYEWTFATSSATQTITGQQARPSIGCNYSQNASTFGMNYVLRVGDATGASVNVSGGQQMSRTGCGI